MSLAANHRWFRPLLFSSLFLATVLSPWANGQQSGSSTTAVQSASPPASSALQFFDSPQFTVSGVTDTTSLGGHGSDAVLRTRDSLTKAAVALGKAPTDTPNVQELQRAKERTQAQLAQHGSAELHHQLADLDEKLGNPLDAVREYECAAKMDATEANVFDWGAELLLHHAAEPASEVFAKGNASFPKSERMLLGLGAAWLARGSTDQAVAFISKASDMRPEDPAPYLFLGRIQAVEKISRDEILRRLQRFVALKPENADANYYYGVGLWKQPGSQKVAHMAPVESLLNTAIRLNPKFTAAYVQLGVVHDEQSKLLQAMADYQKAIQVGSDSSDTVLQEAHYRLAQAYRRAGEVEAAKAESEIYQNMVKASEQQSERERHEIQQFVYTLRDPAATRQTPQ
jgi:tetratricopeptide (TPR) repeat protein